MEILYALNKKTTKTTLWFKFFKSHEGYSKEQKSVISGD